MFPKKGKSNNNGQYNSPSSRSTPPSSYSTPPPPYHKVNANQKDNKKPPKIVPASCLGCGKSKHTSCVASCSGWQNKPVADRWKQVMKFKICRICLCYDCQMNSKCRHKQSTCGHNLPSGDSCKLKHHPSLHNVDAVRRPS